MKIPVVYIMANKKNGTLYTGVTTNIVKRVYEHKHNFTPGFTAKYSCHMLVYYEVHDSLESAVNRERQIKAGSRRKKLELINSMNPRWCDLYQSIV